MIKSEVLHRFYRGIYRRMRRAYLYLAAFGFRGAIIYVRQLFGSRSVVRVYCPRVSVPIHLRLNSTDADAFFQVFYLGEYDVVLKTPPKTILDAGANVGFSSIYFAQQYPDAKVYSIEPEPSNYAMLQCNTCEFPNILPICAALWRATGKVVLSDRSTGEWGFIVTQNGSSTLRTVSEVAATTVSDFMHENMIKWIDLMKLDIEGSEKEVLEDSHAWIENVGVIVAELHDRFKDGCLAAFREATSAFDHKYRHGCIAVAMRDSYFTRAECYHQRTTAPAPNHLSATDGD